MPQHRSGLPARAITVLVALVALASLAACGGDDGGKSATPTGGSSSGSGDIPGVVLERAPGRGHTTQSVDYPQHPPSGGNHDPVWQNCGVYRQPVRDENAVHDLEHGAVWIAYRPDISPAAVSVLEGKAQGQDKILVTPYPGLTKPVVLVSWEHRLELDSASDPRIDQFIAKFEGSSTAPEPTAPCSGGVGTPTG